MKFDEDPESIKVQKGRGSGLGFAYHLSLKANVFRILINLQTLILMVSGGPMIGCWIQHVKVVSSIPEHVTVLSKWETGKF